MAIEIVDLSIKNGDFPQLSQFTRGYRKNDDQTHDISTFQDIYIYTIIISSFSDNPGVSWGVYIFCQRQVRKSWTSRNWEFTNTVDFFLNRSWSSTNDMGLEPALLRGSNTSDICFKSMFLSNHRRIWTSTRGCSGRKIGGDASP